MGINKKNGFTLIEIVIVVGVLGILLPTLFAMLFAIMNQQAKIMQISRLKRDNEFVTSIMKTLIQNDAVEIQTNTGGGNYKSICNSSNNNYTTDSNYNLYFKDKFDNRFRFLVQNNRIASQSSIANTDAYLTTDKIEVTEFKITCNRKSYFTPPIIIVSFTTKSANSQTTLDQKTIIGMREYALFDSIPTPSP